MWVFWGVALSFIAVALAAVLYPLLKKRETLGVDRRAMNVEIYKSQFEELENDLGNGTISEEQHAQARADLERALLTDVPDEQAVKQAQIEQGLARLYTRAAAIVVVIALPLVSLVLYGKIGAGEPGVHPDVAAKMAGGAGAQHKQIAQMVAALAEKL
ncbi:MAG: c-type cytochrome biogenesis protein CcmI, partial [Pseudomonadota bacterium]